MEYNSPLPIKDTLHLMSYSDLKKMGASHGIKGNMKAKHLIAKLLSVSSVDMESFSTPLQKEVNSSQKNKESKFNEDCATPLDTPRRGTYSLEESTLSEKLDVDVTESAGLDESNVTMCRGSERKLRPRKVSFMSPMKVTPKTTRYMSLKDRPKTPVASLSGGRRGAMSTTVAENVKSQKSTQNIHSTISKHVDTLGHVVSSSEENTAEKIRQASTPGSVMKSASKENTVSKLRQAAAPNFQRIHQKAFDKMESIDDYQQRKILNSVKKIARKAYPQFKANSKIPVAFSGIPFIPSVTSCSGLKFNFAPGVPKSFRGKRAQQTSNLTSKSSVKPTAPCTKGKKKFDLKASLSKKLGYIPYRGALKPLSESNCMNTPIPSCHHTVKEPLNKVVHANRSNSRAVLQGVRTNKRFDLQMRNRKID